MRSFLRQGIKLVHCCKGEMLQHKEKEVQFRRAVAAGFGDLEANVTC